ncbi:MAG: DUF3426 domain-containing protein [Thermomonas sp.]|uniref:DUF3426 domain-containing protein n=1 Tax=Thermomonas sp. TaxID=1971895 RepID=UPI0039E47B76
MSRTPSFARVDAPATPRRRRGEWIVLVALLLLLAVQLFFGERERLAADARFRPVVASACALVGCKLPPWRQPAAFSMLARDVIAVPDRPGVLRVQASFRNDARWPQPWPALVLTLSDADSRTLGARRFLPADYLGETPRAGELAPGQSAQLAFDIAEPAPNVVAFDFRFD